MQFSFQTSTLHTVVAFTGCTGCSCDPDGSENLVCNKTTGQCPCRKNSVGKTCNSCPTGYYGLRAPHVEGCLKCHCSNKSNNCSTAEGWSKAELKTELLFLRDNTNMGGWCVVTADGTDSDECFLGLETELEWQFDSIINKVSTYHETLITTSIET